MTLYNYKRFLGDSDKIVQKYFNLKEEVKKREIFRKIGLDKYFQPVTSVVRQEIKPFHNLIKKNEEQIIDMDRDRDRDRDGGWGDRQTERDMVDEDDDTDTINLDDEETVDYNIKSDIESLKNGKSTTDDDDNEEFFSPLEEKQFFPLEIEQPLNNPYDELKNSKFNKKSKEFADEWLKISKEELSYVKGQTNFNSFTRNDLVKYRENLKQMQASSSKRTSNKYIQHYDNDVKNQLKLINDKIGKTIKPGKKEIEKEEKYQKDVEENKKINEMFKQTKKKEGKGVKRGNSNGSLIYYNNPQQLIDRLRLLVGSKRAGNTNPEIDSEIIGISDELVKKGLIMNYDYTNFMNKNLIKF